MRRRWSWRHDACGTSGLESDERDSAQSTTQNFLNGIWCMKTFALYQPFQHRDRSMFQRTQFKIKLSCRRAGEKDKPGLSVEAVQLVCALWLPEDEIWSDEIVCSSGTYVRGNDVVLHASCAYFDTNSDAYTVARHQSTACSRTECESQIYAQFYS